MPREHSDSTEFQRIQIEITRADGRPYLVGGGFSLSDMAFAVALAPLVLPDTYGPISVIHGAATHHEYPGPGSGRQRSRAAP
jgi:hypothetical protein